MSLRSRQQTAFEANLIVDVLAYILRGALVLSCSDGTLLTAECLLLITVYPWQSTE